MKKISKLILVLAALTLLMLVPKDVADADMGIPQELLYTVTIDLDGAQYYATYEHMDNDITDGMLAGGKMFYVWRENAVQGYLYGTDNASYGNQDTDYFIYINDSDVIDSGAEISPDMGTKLPETVHAVTEDNLNLRCGPGTGFNVIEVMDKSEEVTYDCSYTTDSEWVYVTHNGNRGWASKDYLKTTKTESVTKTDSKEKSDEVKEEEEDKGDKKDKDEDKEDEDNSKKSLVAGIVLICMGMAILLAILASRYLKRR